MAAQEKKMRGKAQEAVGRIRQKAGEVMGNDRLRAKGTSDRAAGRTRSKAADAEQTARGTAEELKGKARRKM